MKLSPRLLKLPVNTSGNDFVVGDIHGEVSKLRKQLNEIGFNYKTDRLICVGDLIDRGAESPEALALLNESWFYSVVGNHEVLMVGGLKYQNNKQRMTWIENGGNWIMNTQSSQWPIWFDQIEALPLGIEVTTASGTCYGIIHADYPRDHWGDFEKMSREDCERAVWSRENFRTGAPHSIKGIDWIIHGHNVSDGLRILGNRVYIENGAYLGNDFIIKALK
ncbi:MAG: metallophosphoesterase [Oleibacter sp.]|nr:metallophosphoesterase [Thalassolituus sp.]